MANCKECLKEVGKEWYIPISSGGIIPFCSKECAETHADKLIKQGGYIRVIPEYPNELVIDTGTR